MEGGREGAQGKENAKSDLSEEIVGHGCWGVRSQVPLAWSAFHTPVMELSPGSGTQMI